MKEIVCIVAAFGFLTWAAWLLWNGSHYLFMLPMGLAILCAGALDDHDSGDCDPCLGA